eukprot:364950-Chlamydomonas_euryale.AAC.21
MAVTAAPVCDRCNIDGNADVHPVPTEHAAMAVIAACTCTRFQQSMLPWGRQLLVPATGVRKACCHCSSSRSYLRPVARAHATTVVAAEALCTLVCTASGARNNCRDDSVCQGSNPCCCLCGPFVLH